MKAICILVLASVTATPCLWDSDTIDTELRGVPDAFDLIVGRWHHHGEAYYRERVARLAALPQLTSSDYDDLAVAHEHLGDHDAAIAVMGRKAAALAKEADLGHEYRRLANLGTFHAHAGRYDEALVHLRAAVDLNPNAHFGRERFQIEAIEYVAAAKQRPELWAEMSFLRHAGYRLVMFPVNVAHPAGAILDRELGFETAYKAIGGMLRFGGRESAELFRSLGELMLSQQHLNLAWWAFRRAIERGHPASENLRTVLVSIERHWREAARYNTANPIPDEALYVAMRANADQWVAAFRALEAEAVARGADVRSDEAVRRLLTEADRRVPRLELPTSTIVGWIKKNLTWLGVVVLLGCYVVLRLQGRRQRRVA